MQTPKIFQGADIYVQLLDSFSDNKKIEVDLNSNNISKAMFLDLCKMKHAGWKMKVNFKRHKRHTISEFFQDIVAFYLNACLPQNFEIEVEKKINKTQTDIAIKKNGEYFFLIEVKTTIGYKRPDKNSKDPYKEFRERIENLSENFNVPQENIIYVFEDPGNVRKEFRSKFWDKKQGKPVPPPVDFPFSIIKPLFNANDPSYWVNEKGFDKKTAFKPFNEDEALNRAQNNIVTRFEDVLLQILTAKTK